MTNSTDQATVTIASTMRKHTWSKDDYTITTDPSTIPLDKLSQAFDSPDLHWAMPLPTPTMLEMLDNSLCFAVYHHTSSDSPPDLIGFARCITDFITFVYLTDVYVWPTYQGKGIGSWMISCVQEVVESMPYLRKCMALTGSWDRSVPFYEKLMGMKVVGGKAPVEGEAGTLAVLSANGKGSRV